MFYGNTLFHHKRRSGGILKMENRILKLEDLRIRIEATRGEAKDLCRLALKNNETRAKLIKESPIGFTL